MIVLEEHSGRSRSGGLAAAATGFVVPSRTEAAAIGDTSFALADERLAGLKRDIAALRARHAAMSDAGGRFIHHLGRKIATIETAIGALRAVFPGKESLSDAAKSTRRAELASLESSLREIRGFSGVSEIELAGMLANLMAAQGDAEALLAMIERVIAALQAEFGSIRA